jgi:hypothetical protein
MGKNKKFYLNIIAVAILGAFFGSMTTLCLATWLQPSKLNNVARQAIYYKMTKPKSMFATEIKENNGISSINIFHIRYCETPQGKVAVIKAQVLQRNQVNSKTGMPTSIFLTTERLVKTPIGWIKLDKKQPACNNTNMGYRKLM